MRSRYRGPERRASRPSPFLGFLSALCVAAIVFATFCPPDLRPHVAPATLERFGAFCALGVLLGLFTSRRWPAALAFVVFLAFSLELGQRFAPGRDAAASDAVVKALGGVAGVLAAAAVYGVRRRFLRALGSRPAPASAAALPV